MDRALAVMTLVSAVLIAAWTARKPCTRLWEISVKKRSLQYGLSEPLVRGMHGSLGSLGSLVTAFIGRGQQCLYMIIQSI